jgi:hypothetical protein
MTPSGGQGPASIRFDRDLDGLSNGIVMGVDTTITSTNAGGTDFIPATPDRSTFASPYVAYDRSGGPNNGRLYLAYADENPNESNNFDVFLRSSTTTALHGERRFLSSRTMQGRTAVLPEYFSGPDQRRGLGLLRRAQ